MKPDQSAIALLLAGLSQDEVQELTDIVDYLGEHSRTGQPLPELTVSRLFNQASPKVRDKLLRLSEALETSRFAPYQEKRTVADRAAEFGLDPAVTEMVKGALDDDAIAAGLQRSMGTDASLIYDNGDKPLSLREQLAGAYKIHGGK